MQTGFPESLKILKQCLLVLEQIMEFDKMLVGKLIHISVLRMFFSAFSGCNIFWLEIAFFAEIIIIIILND